MSGAKWTEPAPDGARCAMGSVVGPANWCWGTIDETTGDDLWCTPCAADVEAKRWWPEPGTCDCPGCQEPTT